MDTIYDILVSECGANEDWRENFNRWFNRGTGDEYRFQGNLGHGGKFWRTVGRCRDGSWGIVWRVNGYPEDLEGRPERQETVQRANEALARLQEGAG